MPTIKTSPLTHSLLAGACLALCAATAQAATPTQADLDSVVLYGSTTIAQDSTSAWGIWDALEPTASGPKLPRIDNFGKADLYRPLAQFTLAAAPAVEADVLCSGGSICGFGVFYDPYAYGGRFTAAALTGSDSVAAQPYVDTGVEHSYAFTGSEVAAPATAPVVVTEQLAALSSTSLPTAIELLSQVLNDGTFGMPNSGTLVRTEDGYSSLGGKGDPSFGIYADSYYNDYFDASAVQATWYYGYLSRYVAGPDGQPLQSGTQYVEGVAGITTSSADMSALRASGATATYAGYDARGNSAKPNVTLNVNFGNGSFTGSFNGGADGNNVYTNTSEAGPVLRGQVGFNVTSGTITGSTFKSTGLSATDGTVKGAVTGAFFGPTAAAAGGVADITKTRTDGAYTNGRFVSPFLTIKGLDTNTIRPSSD